MIQHVAPRALLALSLALLIGCGADDETLDTMPPVAVFTVDTEGDPTIRIDARASSDEDGFVVAWTFDYGDGSPTEYSSSPSALHTYVTNGNYSVTVSAIDDLGAKGSASETVLITRATGPVPPTGADAGSDAFAGGSDGGREFDSGLDPGNALDAGSLPDNGADTRSQTDDVQQGQGADGATSIDGGPAPTPFPLPPEPDQTPDAG
jgi:PKD repeat protein